mmetsp:Transcript_22805/g.60071  ORF Transcript_22805/g.60071 Transcript_22805/m.60071 type:complete len:204 (-) Transcript_22805:408-1019(-)
MSSSLATIFMISLSRLIMSIWRFALTTTASLSLARWSYTILRRFPSSPLLMEPTSCASDGVSCRIWSEMGAIAAFTAPQNSWPMTTTTFTLRWCTANSRDAFVVISRRFPATRMTNIPPRPWSKTNSTGTRESEHPRTATFGNCFTMSARLWNAFSTSREGWPIQNRVLPRCKSASTSGGVLASASAADSSHCCRASSMEKPS